MHVRLRSRLRAGSGGPPTVSARPSRGRAWATNRGMQPGRVAAKQPPLIQRAKMGRVEGVRTTLALSWPLTAQGAIGPARHFESEAQDTSRADAAQA